MTYRQSNYGMGRRYTDHVGGRGATTRYTDDYASDLYGYSFTPGYDRNNYYGSMVNGSGGRWRAGSGNHMVRDVNGGGDPAVMLKGGKPIVKQSDMPDYMQQATIDISTYACSRYSHEKDVAAYMKRELDNEFGPAWHVIVGPAGNRFVANVSHSDGFFTYYEIDGMRFMAYRTPQ